MDLDEATEIVEDDADGGHEMDDKTLVRILKQEAEDARSSELEAKQRDAMLRYQAEPYGNELPGRSSVRTHDIEDTLNWVMPHLMRPFLRGDNLVGVDDPGLDDGTPVLREASQYLTHVLRKDNKPKRLIHDLAFDGCLQRVGYARTWWEDPQPKPAKVMQGVIPEQLAQYEADPDYKLLQITPDPDGTYTIKVQRTPRIGRVRMDCVPPEEIRVSKRAPSLDEADYHGWHRSEYLAEIIRDFPDFKDDLEALGRGDENDPNFNGDSRTEARFPDEPSRTDQESSSDEIGRKKVTRSIEYLRCDYNGDGTVELRRICRVGDVILENDEVTESEFSMWSPIRMAHKAIGRSLADTLLDLQLIRTGLTRAALDGLSRSLTTRTAVNMDAANDDTLQDVVDHEVGGVIRVKGDVRAALQEMVTPDVATPALATIEYFDRRSEEASGVTRHAQGIAPEAITKTAQGIKSLQIAANSRIELLAEWLAECIEDMLGKALRLLIAHQDGPRQIKINGKRLQIDPRRWSDEMTVTVHVGAVGEDRDARMAGLGMIAAKQEQIIAQAGLGNPIVSPQEYRNTLALMAETLGHRSPERFFKEIPEGWQPPPPGPDPKLAEVQGKQQLAAADMQGKQALAQAEAQHRAQMSQSDLMHKQQMAEVTTRMSAEQAAAKAESEREIAQIKIRGEMEIQAARMAMEERLAVARMAQERELATMKMKQEGELAEKAMKAKAGDGGSNGGFREGGRLDA